MCTDKRAGAVIAPDGAKADTIDGGRVGKARIGAYTGGVAVVAMARASVIAGV